MIKKHKIVLIVPYFGQFPNYFDLFLESCRYNKNIDWIIVTDNKIEDIYKNIRFINMTFNELKNLIRNKLNNQDIEIYEPYKLCDYKPAYGKIFEDFLKNYDFWGHCDIDLIFGDINNFITDEILYMYDKLFTHGHFTLYRNNQIMNNSYLSDSKNQVTFNKAIKQREIMYFDEIGIVNIFDEKGINQYRKICFLDILPQYKNFKIYSQKNYKNQVFYWDKGKIFKSYINEKKETINEEYMYIHLQKRKFEKHTINIINRSKFYITPNGFVDIDTEAELSKIYKGKFIHVLKYYYNRYKNITPIKIKRKIRMKLEKMM